MTDRDAPSNVEDDGSIDWDRLEHNLRLTVEERLEQHRRALENVMLLRKAGEALREHEEPA